MAVSLPVRPFQQLGKMLEPLGEMLGRTKHQAHIPNPDMIFPTWGSIGGTGYEGFGRYGWLGGTLPGSDTDWMKEAGNPSLNQVAFRCLGWIADNIVEPRLQMARATQPKKRDQGPSETPLRVHPCLEHIARPNPFYDGNSMLAATSWSYSVAGNAYWIKERANNGKVINYWWIPSWMIAPRWNATNFLVDYIYRPMGRGEGIIYDRRDIVHFRWGLDEYTGGRLGAHRTFAVMREIATINESSTYHYSILKNMGIPAILISFKDQFRAYQPEEQDKLREWWRRLFTRDGRGKPGVVDRDANVQQLGLSPEQLRLEHLPTRAELAVCGAFHVHPAVIFVGADLRKGFDNGGQLDSARKASYQDCLVPMCKRFATTLTQEVLPEYEPSAAVLKRMRIRYDFSEVDALAEERGKIATQNNLGVQGGWMRVSEARERFGLVVDDADKVYIRNLNIIATTNYEPEDGPSESDDLEGPDEAEVESAADDADSTTSGARSTDDDDNPRDGGDGDED